MEIGPEDVDLKPRNTTWVSNSLSIHSITHPAKHLGCIVDVGYFPQNHSVVLQLETKRTVCTASGRASACRLVNCMA